MFFSLDQITCISWDMFPNVSPCSCRLIIQNDSVDQEMASRILPYSCVGCGFSSHLKVTGSSFLYGGCLLEFSYEKSPEQAAPKSFTWEGRSLVSRSSPIMRILSSFLLSVKINVSWNFKTTSLKWNKHFLKICNHPIEKNVYKWLFRVPGWYHVMIDKHIMSSISVSFKISPANSKGNINFSSVCSSKNYSSPLA